MSGGELRERVTFQRRAVTSDGYGNSQGDWEDEFTVAARIEPKLGGETIQAARLTGKSIANIIIRCSTDTAQITTDWRAFDARSNTIWNIRSIVNPDENKKYFEILAEKGVAT